MTFGPSCDARVTLVSDREDEPRRPIEHLARREASITRRNQIEVAYKIRSEAPSPAPVAHVGRDGCRHYRPGDRARGTGGTGRDCRQGERRCSARRALRADAHRRLRTVGRDCALRDYERHGDELRLFDHKTERPRDALCLHRPVGWPRGLAGFHDNGHARGRAGVSQSMLGEVSRAGIGEQVTYNGHPLYLFDSVPGLPGGEAYDEPSIPADHGVWWLLSPSGVFVGSEGTLTTVTINGKKELAADTIDGGGVLTVPVYSFSKGTACTGACAADFSPLYAQGSPGLAAGLPTKAGLAMRADGTDQRTWAGKALYLYSNEGFAIGPSGVAAKGNGNGVHVDGGVFSLVTP